MTYAEKLETFADLATESQEFEHCDYPDASSPENIKRAWDYLNRELTFLGGRDKDELVSVWRHACDDCRDVKLLFTAVKVLQIKYVTK